jgi:hypothetical protein
MSYSSDVPKKLLKVEITKRMVDASHTSAKFLATEIDDSVQGTTGFANALGCDVIMRCVDRPWPRHILNVLAYAHLIPVVDGGILARVREDSHLLHVDWRIHTVGPEQACLHCLDALRRSEVALDRDGLLDDPDYLTGRSQADRERYGRRNVFAFSLSVASHQVLQLVGLVSGNERVGGRGPQTYHAYPGTMEACDTITCLPDCDIQPLTALAHENIL